MDRRCSDEQRHRDLRRPLQVLNQATTAGRASGRFAALTADSRRGREERVQTVPGVSGSRVSSRRLRVEIEDEMAGAIPHGLATKAVLLPKAQHAAVAPHDLRDQARDASFPTAGNQPAEQQ